MFNNYTSTKERDYMNSNAIVQIMLGDECNDIDLGDYITIEEQAEMLRELIAIYALYKRDGSLNYYENQSERLSEMVTFIEKSLLNFVERKMR
jgi:hypothetical protein